MLRPVGVEAVRAIVVRALGAVDDGAIGVVRTEVAAVNIGKTVGIEAVKAK